MASFRDLPLIEPVSRSPRDIDDAIGQMLARQGDAIAKHQLYAMGLDRDSVASRVDSRRLYAADVGRDIYTSLPRPLRGDGRIYAALLWAPADALLANTTAASRLDLERHRGSLIHLMLPTETRRPAPGIKLHRATGLTPKDIVIEGPFRCSAAARTILDIAGDAEQDRVDRLVDRSEEIRRYDEAAMRRVLKARTKFPGNAKLEAAMAKLDENSGRFRSEFERRTIELIKTRSTLPVPIVNSLLAGFEHDLYFVNTRAIIELDGRDYHRSMAQRARDAEKEKILTNLGYVFLRLRWEQIVYYPEQGLRRILEHYAANAVPPVHRSGSR